MFLHKFREFVILKTRNFLMTCFFFYLFLFNPFMASVLANSVNSVQNAVSDPGLHCLP